MADPPWPIEWRGGQSRAGLTSGSARLHVKREIPYKTMSVEAIAAVPVNDMAAETAHLFLWAIDRFVLDGSAARVIKEWGFEVVPRMIVWAKKNPGLGRFIRPAHEFILIGRRGGARLNEKAVPSVQYWRQVYENGARAHSAKPDGSIDLIEQVAPGPYLELFARRARFGWDYWGDESLGTAQSL